MELIFDLSVVAAICILTAVHCFDRDTNEPKLMFTQSDFNHFVAQCSLWSVYIGAGVVSTTVIVALYKVIMVAREHVLLTLVVLSIMVG